MTSTRTPVGPIIEPGDEPPGRAVPVELAGIDGSIPGSYRWEGMSQWCTRHGPVVVQHFQKSVTYVWGALLPDGRRGELSPCWDMVSDGVESDGVWRTFRLETGGAFIHGLIEVSPTDVIFTPLAAQPVLSVDAGERPLLEAIRNDSAIMAALQRQEMAFALHDVITRSKDWTLVYRDHRSQFSPRYVGHFVAVLRANGEIYRDYYGRIPEGMTDAHVQEMRDHLLRLGVSGLAE